ncbi:MAG: winged helix-turn-helix transcriptional regulator [Acidimicrobiales bacterium]
MSRNVRTYHHFCMLARALEQVGDRWTLLVVRDLLGAPRRFTDLMALLGGITPKTLAQRLRELQDAGIVDVDRQPGRREVWYRLTSVGADLAPVIESLFLWGLRHAGRPPLPGEDVHAEHLLSALRIVLDLTPGTRQPLVWQLDFVDAGAYTLHYEDGGWTLLHGIDQDTSADVAVTTQTDTWTRFLMTPPDERPADPPGIDLAGSDDEIDRFLQHLARFPYAIPANPASSTATSSSAAWTRAPTVTSSS